MLVISSLRHDFRSNTSEKKRKAIDIDTDADELCNNNEESSLDKDNMVVQDSDESSGSDVTGDISDNDNDSNKGRDSSEQEDSEFRFPDIFLTTRIPSE